MGNILDRIKEHVRDNFTDGVILSPGDFKDLMRDCICKDEPPTEFEFSTINISCDRTIKCGDIVFTPSPSLSSASQQTDRE